jgi:hypothetical protein
MQPFLMRGADFDPFQIAIIVIFVLASFIKWLWENWQLKNEASKRDLPLDPEEQRLREAAWRKQTGQSGDSPPPIPPAVAASPWDDLSNAWKELQEAAKPTPPPIPAARPSQSAAPPLVSQPRPQSVRSQIQSPPPPLATVVSTPTPVVVAKEAYFPQQKTTTVSVLAAVRHLRIDPALMRQAILMQEILGPPKALQTSADLAN